MLGLLVVLVVGAEAEEAQLVRLASPGLAYVDVAPQKGAFFADHLARQLELHGLKVTSRGEIENLLGMERQKQLLGCDADTSSCLAELAGAIGVDGLITGQIAKVGGSYVIDVKIVNTNAKTLAIASGRAAGDEALVDWLDARAPELAKQVLAVLAKKKAPPVGVVELAEPAPVRRWWVIPVVVGSLALIAGVGCWVSAKLFELDLDAGRPATLTRSQLEQGIAASRMFEKIGWGAAVPGLVLVAAGVVLGVTGVGNTGGARPVSVSVALAPGGGGLVFSGVLP